MLQRAVDVRPSPRQLAWQQREISVFIHFGMNTFTGKEWSAGKDNPNVFDPTALDCRQWAEVARDLGAKAILLVAKHHDGFCLWPTRTTDYSVKRSTWQNGKGDVVKELAEACRELGLRLGIYLSAADLHEPTYGVDHEGYNRFFKEQLREVLTNYGDVCEVFFDGASPHERHQNYDYPGYYALIRELQPMAVIAVKGPDVRWVGNEAGMARESEWSVIPLPRPPEQYDWPDMTAQDLGSRARLTNALHLHWYPAEADVSLRPGWFYRPTEDKLIKSLAQLRSIYYTTVGRNAVLLLNLSPDKRGLIPEGDAQRLREFGQWIQATFTTNLARGAKVTCISSAVSNPLAAAVHLTDGKLDTYWRTPNRSDPVELTVTLPTPARFNCVMLQENITLGQRIEAFALDAWLDGVWRELARGTTVGYKRLIRTRETIQAQVLRIRIQELRVYLALAEIAVYADVSL